MNALAGPNPHDCSMGHGKAPGLQRSALPARPKDLFSWQPPFLPTILKKFVLGVCTTSPINVPEGFDPTKTRQPQLSPLKM